MEQLGIAVHVPRYSLGFQDQHTCILCGRPIADRSVHRYDGGEGEGET